jgi:hypothetical protein
MPDTKERLQWNELRSPIQRTIERIAGGPVAAARNMAGGFSPGLASLLRLANGDLVFAKASSELWPIETDFCRTEARVAAALPRSIPAPRLRGAADDGQWVVLVFDGLRGRAPGRPGQVADITKAVAMLADLAHAGSPSPLVLGRDHPRLGGWRRSAEDAAWLRRLPELSPWAQRRLDRLIALEDRGLEVAQGDSLVHFDCYPHNIVMTPDQIYLVDWPHARVGSPLIDLVCLLASVAADGLNPESFARGHWLFQETDSQAIDALVAAHAGFCLAGALPPSPVGRRPIADEKRRLGRGSLAWLSQRLKSR